MKIFLETKINNIISRNEALEAIDKIVDEVKGKDSKMFVLDSLTAMEDKV